MAVVRRRSNPTIPTGFFSKTSNCSCGFFRTCAWCKEAPKRAEIAKDIVRAKREETEAMAKMHLADVNERVSKYEADRRVDLRRLDLWIYTIIGIIVIVLARMYIGYQESFRWVH